MTTDALSVLVATHVELFQGNKGSDEHFRAESGQNDSRPHAQGYVQQACDHGRKTLSLTDRSDQPGIFLGACSTRDRFLGQHQQHTPTEQQTQTATPTAERGGSVEDFERRHLLTTCTMGVVSRS